MANEKQQPKVDPEVLRLKKAEQARRNRRRNRQLIGLALTILIVVGAISIVRGTVEAVKLMVDNTAEYEEYSQRISSLVWFDVLPFESLEKADKNALRQASIWGALNQADPSKLERNEHGEALLPAIEVDRYAAQLFGPDFVFEHNSFEDPVENLSYVFYEDTQMYAIPVTGITPPYLGVVSNIERERGGVRRVTVGYVKTIGSNNELIATPDLDHPSKYMDFLFRRDGSEYFLYAVEPSATQVEISSSRPDSLSDQVSSLLEESSSLGLVDSSMSAGSEEEEASSGSEESSVSSEAA